MGSPKHTMKLLFSLLTLSLFVLVVVSYSQAATVFFLDDGDLVLPHFRVRRDTPPSYGPPAPSYAAPHNRPGRVGPVYTFVKTDPQANIKWGVHDIAGVQY